MSMIFVFSHFKKNFYFMSPVIRLQENFTDFYLEIAYLYIKIKKL